MCTLSIIRDAKSVTVTMNRDDAAARTEAPPSLWPVAKIAFAAPKDLQAGGTWIGVNAHGVIACLLNRYDPAPPARASRGAIVLEAMNAINVEGAYSTLAALDHALYAPFTCMLIDLAGASRFDWTGSMASRTDVDSDDHAMVTSSSWQFDEVSAKRRGLFDMLRETESDAVARIAAFHSHRDSTRDTWAPMMQREHSETKSVTQIELSGEAAEMRYWSRHGAIARGLTAPDTVVRFAAASASDRRSDPCRPAS
jgi:uncharacterized protein with NRDE domain